jgi:hypothetical protein
MKFTFTKGVSTKYTCILLVFITILRKVALKSFDIVFIRDNRCGLVKRLLNDYKLTPSVYGMLVLGAVIAAIY